MYMYRTPHCSGGPWARLGAWAPSLVCSGFARRSSSARRQRLRDFMNLNIVSKKHVPKMPSGRALTIDGLTAWTSTARETGRSCTVALREEKHAKVLKAARARGAAPTGAKGSCVAGQTFGCYPAESPSAEPTMWVREGCRALFFCDGAKTGICGKLEGGGELVAEQMTGFAHSLINCSCARDPKRRDAVNAAWWAKTAKRAEVLRPYDRRRDDAPAGARMRWLLATSIACSKQHEVALASSDVRNFGDASTFHVWINVYDGGEPSSCLSAELLALPYVHTSSVRGFHVRFWKEKLIPEVTRQYDIIAIKDADILVSPHTFVLAEVEYWFRRTNASILTPTIVPRGLGFRAGRTTVSTQRLWADCLAAASPHAEQMKMARADAFERSLWREMLTALPDETLGTDSYLIQLWCIMLATHFPHRPACVHLRHQSVVHLDARSIAKTGQSRAYYSSAIRVTPSGGGGGGGGAARRGGGVAGFAAIVPELYARWPWAFDTFRWNVTARPVCWTVLDEDDRGTVLLDAKREATFQNERVALPISDVTMSAGFSERSLLALRQAAAAVVHAVVPPPAAADVRARGYT